eukprot:XP_011678115.1 PREDICTED: WW domain-containing oxidoreductase [Strongylocentrotus purpuratus]
MEESSDPTKLAQRFDAYSTALHVLQGRDLSGQYAIVTGANSGIGFETALGMALHGVHVVLACRDLKSGNDAASKIKKRLDQAKVVVMQLFSLGEILIHIFFLLSHQCRFIDFYSSKLDLSEVAMPKDKFWPILAYGRSKLCNILHSTELNRRLSPHNVTCNALHPGNMIYTGISKNWWPYRIMFLMVRPFTKSATQGASTSMFCATARELEGVGGMYFNHCCACMPSDEAQNTELATALWDHTDNIIKEALSNNSL